jgi:hypothetical protein
MQIGMEQKFLDRLREFFENNGEFSRLNAALASYFSF